MLVQPQELLKRAQAEKYALGAFNIYNFEGLVAVIETAEALKSPVMVQLHPVALTWNNYRLLDTCLTLAEKSPVPIIVHLDHCHDQEVLQKALENGIKSVMADGSELEFEDNLAFTKTITHLANQKNASVEGEIGKLAGEEDGLAVADYEAKLTNIKEAVEFVTQSGVHSLAVCIGNVHGKYMKPPNLNFARLASIRSEVDIPLVLHGASGLPDDMIQKSIQLGVCKFNVNTEVRTAYLNSMRQIIAGSEKPELVPIIQKSVESMKRVIAGKLELFGSVGKA